MPKIFRNFVAFLSGLIVVTPTQNIGRTSDTRAANLGEAHADVVLKVLKLETNADYTDFLDRKLVEWYAAAPKSDRHAPWIMTERSPRRGEGGAGRVSEMPYMD